MTTQKPEPVAVEQGKRIDPNLWCLHTIGPDGLNAAPDFATAVLWAEYHNRLSDEYTIAKGMQDDPHWPFVRSVVALWPWSPEAHAEDLPKSIAACSPPAAERARLTTDRSLGAHFERMQDMMRRYIEPITYVASFPSDGTKHATEFEEPGPHDSFTNSESKRRRMDRAFIADMIHMMDGPEQRALAATPPVPAISGEGEKMREALKPFADCVEQIDPSESDDEWAKFRLTIGDYRRAATALATPDAAPIGSDDAFAFATKVRDPFPQPHPEATRLALAATPETFPKDSYALAQWLDKALFTDVPTDEAIGSDDAGAGA